MRNDKYMQQLIIKYIEPVGKDYLWGGTRLKEDFNKELDLELLAETGECSTHPDGQSLVVTGEFAGKTLGEVLKLHPEYLGAHPKTMKEFPILIKLIDAKKELSVQLPSDDTYAMKYEGSSFGKMKMWYVLDASKDAKLIYGFNHDIEKKTLKKALEKGVTTQTGDNSFQVLLCIEGCGYICENKLLKMVMIEKKLFLWNKSCSIFMRKFRNMRKIIKKRFIFR